MTFHANCLTRRNEISNPVVRETYEKNIIDLSSAESAQRVVKVKVRALKMSDSLLY